MLRILSPKIRRRRLDDGVIAVHWYAESDIRRRNRDLRNPMVLRSVEDYIAGKRRSKTLLSNIMPVQQNVDKVLASALLI